MATSSRDRTRGGRASTGRARADAEPLTEPGLRNLVAFARLFGIVRYFHPGDEAARADWDAIARRGVAAAEDADGASALRGALEGVFARIAPEVRVFAGRPARDTRMRNEGPVVRWRHLGVGMGEHGVAGRLYVSERALSDGAVRPGSLACSVDAEPLRGRTLRMTVRARARTRKSATASLRLGSSASPSAASAVVTASDWTEHTLEFLVPTNARRLVVEAVLDGPGELRFAVPTLVCLGGGNPAVPLPPVDHARRGLTPPDWWLSHNDGTYVARLEEEAGVGPCLVLERGRAPRLPRADDPHRVNLGAGVSATIPLAIGCARDWKPSPGRRRTKAGARPRLDRSARLAAVTIVWNVFEHFYPYFDVVQTDWNAALRDALRAAAVSADREAFTATLERLVAALHDGHGHVAPQAVAGPRAWLPLQWRWLGADLVVTRALAARAGRAVRPGDVVTAIDGRSVADLFAEHADRTSAATVQHLRFKVARSLLLGPRDAPVTLTVRRDGVERHIRLAFDRAKLVTERRPARVADVGDGIVYFDLDRATDALFRQSLPRLAAARGIVLDLRGYPRVSANFLAHMVDRPVTSAQWHVPVVLRPGRRHMRFAFSNWTLMPQEPTFGCPIAVLTDGRAISYAETCLGIIEHYRLAEIVGGPSAGTNGNVNPFTLPTGHQVMWTGMRVLKHDGSQHHGVGIAPTIPVEPTIDGIGEGRDEVLEAGIAAVSR